MRLARLFGPYMALLVALLLGGCAGPMTLTSQVKSAGAWPTGRAPGRYVFERLPSQAEQPNEQARLEEAAAPALAAHGFVKVDDIAQADVTVQVAARMLIERTARYYDPFWGPMYGAYGTYGTWGWWGRGGGFGARMAYEPPWLRMQVDLLVRDRHGQQQVLYETHAETERYGNGDNRLYPFLFEAAMKDFPLQAVSPRTVVVPIPDDTP
jgi:hypothetical protein